MRWSTRIGMLVMAWMMLGACDTHLEDDQVDDVPAKLGRVKAALTTCPGVGRYCSQELGGVGKTLYECKAKGGAPTALKTCTTFCAAASATKHSFCAKTAKLSAADLAIFAGGSYHGTQLLWSSGKNLVDPYKKSKPCIGAPNKSCTDAGGQCASFMQWETGAPLTSTWAPLEATQMSIADAPDGTLVATFVNRNYGGLPHAMAKCGTQFCDSNWAPPGDNIVRRHSFTSAQLTTWGFRVVAIPSAN